MTFDEALKAIDEKSDMEPYSGLFLIEIEDAKAIVMKLANTYAPTIEMTAKEKDVFDFYRYPEYDDYDEPFSNFMHRLNSMGGYREIHSLFLNLSEEDLMNAWIHPETIKIEE